MGAGSEPVGTIASTELPQGPLRLLVESGLRLARERSLDVVVQSALEAGRELLGADSGAFLYTSYAADGAPCPLFKLDGLFATDAARFPLRHGGSVVAEAFFGGGLLRCHDILPDAHFGPGTPFEPFTSLEPPVRSYMAVPVHSATGGMLGGMLFTHCDPGKFERSAEPLIEALAAQAAVAIENAQLHEGMARASTAANMAGQLQRDKDTTELRLRQALDAAQMGTWTWDRGTDMLDLDDRAGELFGVPAHVPVGRSELRDRIVVEDDRKLTVMNLQQAVESGTLYHAEYRVPGEGSAPRWIAASGVPTYGAEPGEVTGMVGTIQDVTLRRSQEEALRQSEKLAATGRMAATIAHEINNPLEAVTNLIYLVKTDPSVPPEMQRLLETADQELARVAQIAQQTLGFYRDTTRPMLIDVADLLRSVVGLFERKLKYKKIECVLDLGEDLQIVGLQGELRQVFSNLIVNAVDASLHGRIVIRGRRAYVNSRPGVRVLICDQGTGIPENVRARLFSPFFTTKQAVGTGLGLWVTRGIVEKQGGSVRFRSSTAPPTGTIFRVHLPSLPEEFSRQGTSPKFLQ